jgi:hypothetical protein
MEELETSKDIMPWTNQIQEAATPPRSGLGHGFEQNMCDDPPMTHLRNFGSFRDVVNTIDPIFCS